MKEPLPNHYERAFENWLIDNGIRYEAVDEHKRASFGPDGVKSFDFLLYPQQRETIIAEVKGRTFKGSSLAGLAGLECWVTAEDVEGLVKWQQALGTGHQSTFVFVYRIDNVDVDSDGWELFDYDSNRYAFFCIRLDDYRKFMKRRSPKWQTVTLPAEKFRQCAVHISEFLL